MHPTRAAIALIQYKEQDRRSHFYPYSDLSDRLTVNSTPNCDGNENTAGIALYASIQTTRLAIAPDLLAYG
ncbi:hypothetical protein [Nostoc sp.]|uniref:hypothetical protein n=1 Tax=Nostoc sp. TaxID=1180 RepID=UPI002FF8BCA8